MPKTYHRVREVVIDGRLRRVKFCPGCGRDRIAEPGGDFWVQGHHPSGKPYFSPVCGECGVRMRRERRERDPEVAERERAYHREWRREWLKEPENRERQRRAGRRYFRRRRARDPKGINEEARLQYALRRERAGKPVRSRSRSGYGGRLSASRFVSWLTTYQREVGIESAEGLARDLGLVSRRVTSLLNGEQPHVAFDVVDHALTHARFTVVVDGELVVRIDDLYPYEEEAA